MTNGVNLIPAKLQTRRRLRRHRAAWFRGGGGYAALLVAGCLLWRVCFVTPPAALADEVQRAHHEADDRSAELAKLRAELAEARASMRISESLAGRPDWSDLLGLVAHACGSDVVLKRCEIAAPGELPPPDVHIAPAAGAQAAPGGAVKPAEPPRAILRIQGLGQSQAAVSRFALKLEQTGVFESIEPSSNRETFDGAEIVAFHLDCWLISGSTATRRPAPAGARAGNDATGAVP